MQVSQRFYTLVYQRLEKKIIVSFFYTLTFIQKRLLDAMKSVENQLKPDEKSRNAHGPCLLYSYTSDMQETFRSMSPAVFPDIINNHARWL